LVLEDLLGLPQLVLPPDWVAGVAMPIIPEIDDAITGKQSALAELQAEIARDEKQKAELEAYKALLYAGSFELEDIFGKSLHRCGGTIKPAKYSQEEFVLEYKGGVYLIECKGVGRSMALTHLRQLMDYMMKYQEDTGEKGRGILLGNPWRDRPLAERDTKETVIFPDNVIGRANEWKVSLVWSVDFFQAFCRFLAGSETGEAILDRITNSVGIVKFE
jgi:hypothetical protein